MLMIQEREDVFTYLSRQKKPIVMYGMGNGADKILSALSEYGVEVADFFASDGFVRGHFFHGKKVLSFSEIKSKYGDFIILVSFATSIPEVMERIYSLADEYELYAPDVPLFGNDLFTYDFFKNNISRISAAYALLSDERSRQVFSDVVNFKLSGKLKYLVNSQNDKIDIAKNLLKCYNYKKYLDGGAYTGDSVLEFSDLFPMLETVYAFEPDPKNFAKLQKNTAKLTDKALYLYNNALWDVKEQMAFDGAAGRNSAILSGKASASSVKRIASIPCLSIDEALTGAPVDFIKLDVEGAEERALKGAEKTLRAFVPDMQISVYHRSGDFFDLILKLEELKLPYRYFLRRIPYIPAWDLNLYTIKK